MITPEQITSLEAAAESWRGTPFCEGSPVKGAGVSCHHCVTEIYFDSGLIPRIPIPNGPSRWSAANSQSLIVEWVEQSGLFVSVGKDLTDAIKVAHDSDDKRREASLIGELLKLTRPGDALGFRVVNAIHHAAIQLRAGRIVHSVMKHGVLVAPSIPFEWERRLGAVWRIRQLA